MNIQNREHVAASFAALGCSSQSWTTDFADSQAGRRLPDAETGIEPASGPGPAAGSGAGVLAASLCLKGLFLADCPDAVRDALGEAAKGFGYSFASYHLLMRGTASMVSTLPDVASASGSQGEIEPLLAMVASGSGPAEWTVPTSLQPSDPKSAMATFVAQLGRIGVRLGISLPVTFSSGSGMLTFYAMADADRDIAGVSEAMPLIALAIHTKIQAMPDFRFACSTATLSCRERECIAWAAQGKSVAETSKLMGITERTVLFHISNVKRRLGAGTIAHAVFKSYA